MQRQNIDLVALEFKKDGETVYLCILESDLEQFRLSHGNDMAGALKGWTKPMGVCDEPEEAAQDFLFCMSIIRGQQAEYLPTVRVIYQH